MIGVAAREDQSEAVREFFQFFKTHWEFYEESHIYEAVIATAPDFRGADAKLTVISGAVQRPFDSRECIRTVPVDGGAFLQTDHVEFPVYKSLSAIQGEGRQILRVKGGPDLAGVEIEKSGSRIIRVGYDVFEEVSFLLSTGQPPENAAIPTLDLHIALLRSWMLDCGISFVEIPPVPAGFNFCACLTHDIDFIRIRDHRFDHTMFGFLYRATVGTLVNVLNGRRPWKALLQNWKAVLALPLVHLGVCRDPWFSFDRYMEIEKGMKSTFFLIPFKNQPGGKIMDDHADRRAAKYDIQDIRDTARGLVERGAEIGVHGIDAWHDPASARQELARVSEVTGRKDIGIRSHWLCFDEASPRILEEAGFAYDSTFGYNGAAGFRAGSLQPFKPLKAKSLLELPLNVQDTSLFNPHHMDLTEPKARQLCRRLIAKAVTHGGALTFLWHDRSLAPERLYEDFYLGLLSDLQANNAWFATGGEAAGWYRQRRSIAFEEVRFEDDAVCVRLLHDGIDIRPAPVLRIHIAGAREGGQSGASRHREYSADIPCTGERDLRIPIEGIIGKAASNI